MEEFKHSASVRLVSRITGLNLQQSYWLCFILNFAVIAALIRVGWTEVSAGNVSRPHGRDSEGHAGGPKGQRRGSTQARGD